LFVTAKGTITVQATNPAPNAKELENQATDCHARAARELGLLVVNGYWLLGNSEWEIVNGE
jgi:hypothetical protein